MDRAGAGAVARAIPPKKHNTEGALHPHDDSFIPLGIKNTLRHETEGVGAKDHTGDQPAQDGGHF